MNDIELPPLPAPFMELHRDLGTTVYDAWVAQMQAFARAAVEADRAQRVPDVAEIRRVLACVKSSVDSGIPVTDGWRILDALLASTPAPAQQDIPLEFQKVLSDNLWDLYADGTAQHQEPPQQERKPMTDEQDRALCEAYCNAASDEYFKARPQLDSDVNRRIFCAGHRNAWLEWQTAHGIKE